MDTLTLFKPSLSSRPPSDMNPPLGEIAHRFLTGSSLLLRTTNGVSWAILKFGKAIKESAVAKFLVDRTVKNYEPINLDIPDEDVMTIEENKPIEESWRMYFDGAINALGHGIGAILISLDRHYYPIMARLNFNYTNNVAECEACVMGLQATIDKKIKMLDVFEDSTLVIYQLRGEWETRDFKLIWYHKYISELFKQFKEIQFEHLSRKENQIADALATLAIMLK
ncbi:uncharacterized protein LOC111307564 [Durio zibethinus]|uniref:Uncharacterized protein LOC111307564 n=1 Tax=Durio zibethinus TaxID=66656 RepID=A0A6P6A8Q1_DURZI|nr:uncharacterized protein LOC111307564 [Durio zibethinus]